jgi:PAS domain S-box-containing protein
VLGCSRKSEGNKFILLADGLEFFARILVYLHEDVHPDMESNAEQRDISDYVTRAKELARCALEDARRMLLGLRPKSLEGAQLCEALKRLAENFWGDCVGVLISDSEGQILRSNDAFLRIVGYNREDLVSGRIRCRDLTPAEWQASSEQAAAQIKATGACEVFEKEYYRNDGRRVPVLVGAAGLEGNSRVFRAAGRRPLRQARGPPLRSAPAYAHAG